MQRHIQPIFPAAVVRVAKGRKRLEHPLRDGGIQKMRRVYIMRCYSATTKMKALPFATTRMGRENAMLSETKQREKVKNHIILLIGGILKCKVTSEKQDRQTNKNSQTQSMVW